MASATNSLSGKIAGGSATAARLEDIQQEAEIAGLPCYDAWCAALERRYAVMPPWYWDSRKRRAAYAAEVAATREWQRKQAQINGENRRFFGALFRSRGA